MTISTPSAALHCPRSNPDLSMMSPPARDAVCQHTRPIVSHIKKSAPATSLSPLALAIYHVPATRESAHWLQPDMLNAALEPEAHLARPVHIASLVASWTWFSWLVSRPGLDAGPILGDGHVLANQPISAHGMAHFQLQGPTNLVRVHPVTDLRAKDAQGWNVMHYAVLGDAIEWKRWLLRGGAFREFVPRYSALVWKVDVPLARELCAAREMQYGLSPLDVAIAMSSTQTVLFLLAHDLVPTPGSTDHAGRSPFHHLRSLDLLRLLLSFHPEVVQQWILTIDGKGTPAWACALLLSSSADVAHAMVAIMDFVYSGGGTWLPHTELPHVQDAINAIVLERRAMGELNDEICQLVLGWTSRQAVGFAPNPALGIASLAAELSESNDLEMHNHTMATQQPVDPVVLDDSASQRTPTSPNHPSSSLTQASLSSASDLSSTTTTTNKNNVDSFIQVHVSHAPCPVPNCNYSSTPLYCDDLVTHLAKHHSNPLPAPSSANGQYSCSFPGCFKVVTRPSDLKCHVPMHAPHMYRCTFDPKQCQVTQPSRGLLRAHVKKMHGSRKKKKVAPGKQVRAHQEQGGLSELSDVDLSDDDSAVGVAAIPSPPSPPQFERRQMARKSTGARRGWGTDPRFIIPASKIEVEIPLIMTNVVIRNSPEPTSLPSALSSTSAASTLNSPTLQPPAPGHFTMPLDESILTAGPPASFRTRSSPPQLAQRDWEINDVDMGDDVIDITPLHLGSQGARASSHLSESDDDVVDVTPLHFVAQRAPSKAPSNVPERSPLMWPSYLPSRVSFANSPRADRDVVIIGDSDEEDERTPPSTSSLQAPPSHPLLVHYAVHSTHPLLALALTPPRDIVGPTHHAFATAADSTYFWANVFKLIRDAPALYPPLARQYLPADYTGTAPNLYIHRVSGQPLLSFDQPDMVATSGISGYMLVPLPPAAMDKSLEASVSLTVAGCPLPAELQAALGKATNTYWVDRIKRPVDLYSASRDSVYFVVDPILVTMAGDALASVGHFGGEANRARGLPTAVHSPPLVRVAVRSTSAEVEQESICAVVVVMRRKVLEWCLVLLGFPKPGEEEHVGGVLNQKVVWH